jgi:uncharacterized repeat protein (TIGR03803 family)
VFALGAIVCLTTLTSAQVEHVLYRFGVPANDASSPWSSLVADGTGNLYGTTVAGGDFTNGTVYELVRPTSGPWVRKILYSFGANSNDGIFPEAGVIFDHAGNLYGTTFAGPIGSQGAGTVYELSPPASGSGPWTETILSSLPANGLGTGGLVFGPKGVLYGVSVYGGSASRGAVFELRPPAVAGGPWQEQIIYNFTGAPSSSTEPEYGCASLTLDAAGNLYGTAVFGGAFDSGTVFRLSPTPGGGHWTETILYSFGATSTDGIVPIAKLVFDAAGNLYGTTSGGGTIAEGTVFELSPPTVSGGAWTETILHNFDGTDGSNIRAGVIRDSAGNLYGTAFAGEPPANEGAVFKLAPPSSPGGTWTETTLHSFAGPPDGSEPYAGLLLDHSGNLVGATSAGGNPNTCDNAGCGMVFAIKP